MRVSSENGKFTRPESLKDLERARGRYPVSVEQVGQDSICLHIVLKRRFRTTKGLVK